MAILIRILLWLAWVAGVSWSWQADMLGAGTSLALGALSLVVFAWPASSARRRSTELRYVDVGKEPAGLY